MSRFRNRRNRGAQQQQQLKPPAPMTISALEQVREVFPDVQLDHAFRLLKHHDNHASHVIEELAAEGGYPKDEAANNNNRPSRPLPPPRMIASSSFQLTDLYKSQCIEQLVVDFPFLSKAEARRSLKENSNRYANTHAKILQAFLVSTDNNKSSANTTGEQDDDHDGSSNTRRNYEVYKAVLADRSSLSTAQLRNLAEAFQVELGASTAYMWYLRLRRKRAFISDPALLAEIQTVQTKLQEQLQGAKVELERHEARRASIQKGLSVECACCYDQYAFEEMVACRREGHLFCRNCLCSFVETQVFSNGNLGIDSETKEPLLELLCFHGDGCTSGFDRSSLKKALKPKVLQEYDLLQTRIAIQLAGLLGDLCTCPQCGFEALLPGDESVFACQANDCRFKSCRLCGEATHAPFPCENQQQAKGRARVEEAASSAVIRTCPKCKKGVIKSDESVGCNKMTCACGAKWCYLCLKTIRTYSHFCQRPHCRHTTPEECEFKCPLWSKDAEEDKERIRLAVAEEAQRIKQSDDDVLVDIEEVLRDPSQGE